MFEPESQHGVRGEQTALPAVLQWQGAVLGCGVKEEGFIGMKDTAAGLQISPRSLSALWQSRHSALHCSARLHEWVPVGRCAGMGWKGACQYCTTQPQMLQSCKYKCWVGAPQLSASTGAGDMEEVLQE